MAVLLFSMNQAWSNLVVLLSSKRILALLKQFWTRTWLFKVLYLLTIFLLHFCASIRKNIVVLGPLCSVLASIVQSNALCSIPKLQQCVPPNVFIFHQTYNDETFLFFYNHETCVRYPFHWPFLYILILNN